MKSNAVLLLLLAVLFSIPVVLATGDIVVNDISGDMTVLVGNLSQNYTLIANISSNETQILGFNITFILPYGLQNITACNAITNPNPTTTTCTIIYSPTNASAVDLHANLTVIANMSAYATYGAYNINFSVTGENASANSMLKAVSGFHMWKNPRPDVAGNAMQGNMTLRFVDWNQTDATYKVMAPIWTYNSTANRPQLASGAYGDVMYFDKSFFEEPEYMRLWGYNLSFRLVFSGYSENETQTFIIKSPINTTLYSDQTLAPILVRTEEERNPHSNNTRNFTIGVPSPTSDFSVFVGNTNYTSSYLVQQGLNISVGLGDQSTNLLTVAVNSSNITLFNDTEIYVMFTLLNVSACDAGSCQRSPIYVEVQNNHGLDFDQPPAFGQSLNISFLINVTNRLANYTLSDLRLSFMQPMNVTMNESGTVKQFNMTLPTQVKMLVWNSTASWQENLSTIRTDSNITFTESMGPAEDASINLYVSTFEVLISNNTATFSGWDPGTGGSGYAYVNFTAEMVFPTLSEAGAPNGSAGYNFSYNATTNSPVRTSLNLTDKVPGFNSSAKNINITLNGVQLSASNYTVGSLILNDVSSGSNTIAVSYETPGTAAAATSSSTSSSSSSSSGGGSAPQTDKKIHSWTNAVPGIQYFMNVSSTKIPVSEIHYRILRKIESVQLVVESLSARPANISIEPQGLVYQYIDITPTGLASSDLAEAKIRFTVPQSWLDDNGFAPADVSLQRFSDSSWEELATTPLGASGDNYEFETETPGFSTFAITAAAAEAPTESETAGEEPSEEVPADLPPPPPAPTQPPAEEEPIEMPTQAIAIVLVLIVIGILGYFHYHHPKTAVNRR